MRVAVTGATGLIGSQVVRELLESGEDVRILRRESSRLDLLAECATGVEHRVGEIDDREFVGKQFADVDAVFHIAGAVGLRGKKYRELLRRVNVISTAVVVDAAVDAGVDRLVHTSSIAALGRPGGDNVLIDENAEWVESRNNSEYAISKRNAELEVYRAIAEGLDAVLVNPSLVFGPGRSGQNTVQIVDTVRARRIPAVPVGGTNVVDVRDVAHGHVLALQHGKIGARYILGSENLSWREILETIADAFGVAAPTVSLSPRLSMALATMLELVGHIPGLQPMITREAARQTSGRFWYDTTRARTELGCSFRPFAETMAWVADSTMVA